MDIHIQDRQIANRYTYTDRYTFTDRQIADRYTYTDMI